MTTSRIVLPQPRAAVADPALIRPDWTKNDGRNPDLLWLDKNENTDPEMIALVTRLIGEVDPSAACAYPEPHRLYVRLAEHLGVGIGQVVLAPGSDGIIRSVFEAYVEHGDAVVHTSPTFAMYAVYTRMYGARPVTVSYRSTPSGPALDVEELIDAIRSAAPRIVFIPNPDSPTGTVLPEADLRAVIEAAGEAGALAFVDEAYHPFYERSALPMLADYPHMVIARTCAKAWGLAGLRIGYGVASEDITLMLHKVRNNYEVNMFAVALMEKLLQHESAMWESVRRLNEGRDYFLSQMSALGFRTLPANANFLHVAFGDAAPRVHDALADLVLYRRDFPHSALSGFSRFSATTRERFEPVVARIRTAIGQ